MDVVTYEEFLKSDCELVLLVIDSSYVAIYCKNKDQLDDLYKNALSKEYEYIDYITDDNDFRTKLSVW